MNLMGDTSEKIIRYVLIVLIVAVLIALGVREYQHHETETALRAQVQTVQDELKDKVPGTTVEPTNTPVTPATISAAGDINAAQANEFSKQVVKHDQAVDSGKSKNLYAYTTDASPEDTVAVIKDQIRNKSAPKEVNDADFVTVTTTATTEKPNIISGGQAPSYTKTEDANTTAPVTPTTTVQETTVKVNAYYNYQPSVYYVPQAYPDTGKRHDIVYTNRDFLIDVNYDADRDGNKVGVAVGYRIAKW